MDGTLALGDLALRVFLGLLEVALDHRHLEFVAVLPQVQLLPQPDGAKRVDAGMGRLATVEQRETGAAAATPNQNSTSPSSQR